MVAQIGIILVDEGPDLDFAKELTTFVRETFRSFDFTGNIFPIDDAYGQILQNELTIGFLNRLNKRLKSV